VASGAGAMLTGAALVVLQRALFVEGWNRCRIEPRSVSGVLCPRPCVLIAYVGCLMSHCMLISDRP
jgi:hypothetical protein